MATLLRRNWQLPPIILFAFLSQVSLALSQSSEADGGDDGTTDAATSTTTSKTSATGSSVEASTKGSATATSYMPAVTAISKGTDEYVYTGCYNETTEITAANGRRALPGGKMQGDDELTPERCFDFCAGTQYAGLEYGRECWCSPYLSALSLKLPDQACGFPCAGDPSVACGGSLTITLYNLTSGFGVNSTEDEDAAPVVQASASLAVYAAVGVLGLAAFFVGL